MKLSTLYENIEITEAGGEFGLARDLAKATKEAEKVAHLAQFFKVGEDVVKMAAAKDLTTLAKDFEKAVKNDLSKGFRTGEAASLGTQSKIVAKQKAINEILNSGKELSEGDIRAIIDRVSSQSKNTFKNAEAKFLGRTKVGPEPVEPVNPVKPVKPVNPILPKVWKALKARWVLRLIGLGLIVGVGAAGLTALRGRLKPGESEDSGPELPSCLLELLNKPGCTLESTASVEGDPVIVLTQTGEEEYDKAGGLKFYMDYTVTTGDGKRKGEWKCKGETADVIQEDSTLVDIFENILFDNELLLTERDITDTRYRRVLRRIARNLKNDVNLKNLSRALRILDRLKEHTFEGEDVISLLMRDYRELHKSDMILDVQNATKGLDAPGRRDRSALLALLQSKSGATAETGTEGEATAGGGNPLDGISITWNDVNITPDDTTTDTSTQSTGKYRPCTDLPFKFGCNNPMIKEMQVCLDMEEKYQTGNFGPITYERLTTAKYDLSDGITKEIYDNVLMKCGKVFEKPLEKVNPISPPQSIKPITPQRVPQIDKLKPIRTSNIDPKINPQIDKLKPNVTGDIQNKVNQPTITQNEKTFDNRADYENYLRSIGQPIPPTTRELLRKKEEQDKKNRL